MIQRIEGGVCSPKGFSAAGVAAGIKKQGKDMAMLCAGVPCTAAGTFTSNRVKAAPVLWDRDRIREQGQAQVCVMNSGIANACTGEEGYEACRDTAKIAASVLGVPEELVLVASTGVIGRMLPMDRIEAGIRTMAGVLSDQDAAGTDAARAIMTTDTKKKETAVTFELGGKTVTIGGMSKGAGMIHPQMCTMLAFITTDAAISSEMLQKALSADIKETYNMISVDGDTSTNDTCVLLASGLAGNPVIDSENEDYETFCRALHEVNAYLARHMAADGEGATALLEVVVQGAADHEQAAVIARSVVSSNLVKTAVAGHDANWGRILCAMGYSGAGFDPEQVDLTLASRAGTLKIVEGGKALGYSEEAATQILSDDEITVTADLHEGSESATAWGCDLTHEYISINADYRS